MAASVTEKNRPKTIKVWLANVATCFDGLDLSQTAKNALLAEVLSTNIAFGEASALRLSRPSASSRRRRAKAEADVLDRAAGIIDSNIFRPTLKTGRVQYGVALEQAAPLVRPSSAGSRPALHAEVDVTLVMGTLDLLRRLATVLREAGATTLEPFAASRKDRAGMRALKGVLSDKGKRHQVRTFVHQLLNIWQSASGVQISKMKVGNPDSGPGRLLLFLVAASAPILEIPAGRRPHIGASSLRAYATATIKSAIKFGDDAV